MLPLLGVGLILLGVGYILKTLWLKKNNPLSKIPGPWYARLTDNVLRYYTLTGGRVFYVDSLHQKYGQVVQIAPNEIAIADLEGFSTIHKIGSGFNKSEWYRTVLVGSQGVMNLIHPREHATRRRLLAREFSKTSIRQKWDEQIRQKADLVVQKIKNEAQNGKTNVMKWWTLVAGDMIFNFNFGESTGMLEAGKSTPYMAALNDLGLDTTLASELPLVHAICRLIPSRRLKEILGALPVVSKEGAVAVRNMRNQQSNSHSLFGQLLAHSDSQEKGLMTENEVQQEAGSLMLAGTDTTSTSMTFLVWAVLKNPALQRQLEEEVAGLSEKLTWDELEQAPLMNSVIEETLRLYGAAPGALPRVVPAQGTQINGYHIPANTIVTTQAYTFHRDPVVFPNPYEFDPFRFIDKSSWTASQKTAFHPFGAGSRVCLGIHLAYMELRLWTALFFRECRGARLADNMTDDMMELVNYFLVSPKGHCCYVTLPN